MSDPELGVQLVFIPEEYGGMGGGAYDSYRVCESLARKDIGLGTAVFATQLGSVRSWSARPRSRRGVARRDRREGDHLRRDGATEPEAGSDLARADHDRDPDRQR